MPARTAGAWLAGYFQWCGAETSVTVGLKMTVWSEQEDPSAGMTNKTLI